MGGIEEAAPPLYTDALVWLFKKIRDKNRNKSSFELADTGTSTDAAAAAAAAEPSEVMKVPALPCCLVVTHREGIRDMMGMYIRLPYCAMARFKVEPCTIKSSIEGSPFESNTEFSCQTFQRTSFHLLSLTDRDGTTRL